jgi:glycosyltransferase involved in cell wall biosynthesis
VIIPAHNEAAVIGRTLTRLRPLLDDPEVDVLVVCNGCADDTAAIARRFPGATVLEIAAASKPAAMNAGDRATDRWPRLYLDADIEVDPSAVYAVFRELAEPEEVVAARPEAVFDTSEASWPVRAYYRARTRLPEEGVRLWGAGGYAVSRKGHQRFAAFPEVTADDSYFDALFADHEKTVVSTPPMRIRTPQTASALLAILTRHRRGHVELSSAPAGSGQRLRAVAGTVRGPRSAVDAACYAAFAIVAHLRSRSVVGSGTSRWEKDASTRATAGAH